MDHSPRIINSIVVFTEEEALAAEAAAVVNETGLAEQVPHGCVVIEGRPVRWAHLSALRSFDSWQ